MKELTLHQKKMVALALFSQAMRSGPVLFSMTEEVVEALGIEAEFIDYAQSFKDKSEGIKDAEKTLS